jgi:hypothetical protein
MKIIISARLFVYIIFKGHIYIFAATTKEVRSPKTIRIRKCSVVKPQSNEQIVGKQNSKLSEETIDELSLETNSRDESIPENVTSLVITRGRKRKRKSKFELSNSELNSESQNITESEILSENEIINLQPVVVLRQVEFSSRRSVGKVDHSLNGQTPQEVQEQNPSILSQDGKLKDGLEGEKISRTDDEVCASIKPVVADSQMKPICTFCEKSYFDINNLKRHIKLRCPVVRKLKAEEKMNELKS